MLNNKTKQTIFKLIFTIFHFQMEANVIDLDLHSRSLLELKFKLLSLLSLSFYVIAKTPTVYLPALADCTKCDY